MTRRPLAPLLLTGCDCCLRRRTCASFRDLGLWLCRACIQRLMPRITAALREFTEQGR